MNVVVQPGHWRVPRVDHLGIALDEDDFQSVLGRAMQWNLRVQEHGGRRTFVATNAGYRLEVHPPREWIDELLENKDDLQLAELQLRADEPDAKAGSARGPPRARGARQRGRRRRHDRPLRRGRPRGPTRAVR